MSFRGQTFGGGKFYSRFPDNSHGFIGNVPSAELVPGITKLEHRSRTGKSAFKDFSALQEVDWTFNFSTDDLAKENIQMLFMGSIQTHVQLASSTDVSETFVRALPGRTFFLGQNAATPEGIRNTTVKTVTAAPSTGGGASVELVAGIDYISNAWDASVRLMTAAEGGSFIAGHDLTITYATIGHTRERVISGEDVVYTSIRFIEENLVGEDRTVVLPSVAIYPEGSYGLIADDWKTASFTCDVFKKGDLPAIIIDGKAVV